jgi:hypothetical protein
MCVYHLKLIQGSNIPQIKAIVHKIFCRTCIRNTENNTPILERFTYCILLTKSKMENILMSFLFQWHKKSKCLHKQPLLKVKRLCQLLYTSYLVLLGSTFTVIIIITHTGWTVPYVMNSENPRLLN